MKVWIGRSPWRLVIYAIAGAVLVLTAIEVGVAYRFYPQPDATESTVAADDGTERVVRTLTRDGEAQRRRDVAVALGIGAAGLVVLGWSARDVLARRAVVRLDDEGIALRVGNRREPPLRLGWEDIVEVRSGVREDDAGRTPVLSLRFADPGALPHRPRGGVAEPPWLHLFSEEWETPARQLAPIIAHRIGGFRGADQYR